MRITTILDSSSIYETSSYKKSYDDDTDWELPDQNEYDLTNNNDDEPYPDSIDDWSMLHPETEQFLKSPSLVRAIQRRRKRPSHKMIGSGSFAYTGTDDNDNFGDIHRLSSNDDGTSIYLQTIARTPSLQINPYFPKVRNIQVGRKNQTTVMERLIPIYTTAIVENEQMMMKVWNQIYIDSPDTTHWFDFPEGMIDLIAEDIGDCIKGDEDIINKIKDQNLLKATQVIGQIVSTYEDRVRIDTHPGNIMWRPTQFGPHIVITDPICAR